jgi:hypothetical protein
VLDPAAFNIDGGLPEDSVSSIQLDGAVLCKHDVPNLEYLRVPQHSLQKLTGFSLGNNEQDTPASGTDCIVP